MSSVLPLHKVGWNRVKIRWTLGSAPLEMDLELLREKRVKYLGTLNVRVECSLGCSQEKEREGPWSGSENRRICCYLYWPTFELWDLLERREPNPAFVFWLTDTRPVLKGKSNVYILLWKVNVFFTACVCVYVFRNVNSWAPSFTFKTGFTVWKAS